MKQYYQIQILGMVQGVSFRFYTKKKADELELTGLVTNQSDGSVYIEVSGDTLPLSNFIEWCHQGSPLAKVDRIIAHETKEPFDYQNFEIQY